MQPVSKQNPLFSVLIANHNDGKYLYEAVDSVRKQSYSNWEIVIVDDGSTDDSPLVYDQFLSDNRIRIYHNDNNKGCGYTKKRCIDMARGVLCGFLDADDILGDDALAIMVDMHLKNPSYSLIYSTYYKCNECLEVEWISSHQMSIPKESSFLECNHRGAISQFATFKKYLYQETEGINPFLMVAEDKDLYYKLEEVGPILFVNKPLYYYRCNTGNNCSLDVNSQNATIWEFLAQYEACKRRKIDIISTAFPLINGIIESVYSTKTYRLGRFIVAPFLFLKRFCSTYLGR